MPPTEHEPLHDSDQRRSPDYLEGRQDGLSYAAQIIDGYRQRFALAITPDADVHLAAISEGLKFGTQMLDMTGGVMPPRPTKERESDGPPF